MKAQTSIYQQDKQPVYHLKDKSGFILSSIKATNHEHADYLFDNWSIYVNSGVGVVDMYPGYCVVLAESE